MALGTPAGDGTTPRTSAATRIIRRRTSSPTFAWAVGGFKVVLTVTRSPGTGPGPMATVTAAGYRHTPRGWPRQHWLTWLNPLRGRKKPRRCASDSG